MGIKPVARNRWRLYMYASISSVFTVRSSIVPSSNSVGWLISGGSLARPKMTLNLDAGGNMAGTDGNPGGQLAPKKPSGLNLGLPLEINTVRGSADLVDAELPLERQGWVACCLLSFEISFFDAQHLLVMRCLSRESLITSLTTNSIKVKHSHLHSFAFVFVCFSFKFLRVHSSHRTHC